MNISFDGGATMMPLPLSPFLAMMDPSITERKHEILTSRQKYKVVQAVRQSGKTSMIVDYALALSHIKPHNTTVIATVDENNKNYVLRSVMDTYQKILKAFKVGIVKTDRNGIRFSNGSQILVVAGYKVDSLRGLQVDDFLVDEFAFFRRTEGCELVLSCLHPMFKNVLIMSTRTSRSKRNPFWKLWLSAVNGTSKFTPYTIRVSDCPHLKDVSKRCKCHMSRSQYETEFGIRKR